ncbi:glutathione S-transferase N-terminal domain-containing protein [Falsiroseomonas sp.]|uniref:glutathione S-transferase N-terminal domain-containing protein n=1 Tax=Falsiroseomonas sp. TaxID=2870721 RepID=UPI002720D9C4|nr:glutathione S-transferase N-terminal domain-containing protein [Falsiroseomonas sp.]MDO9499702.1 glutathione S-transferase N-terminal domain-containing protein [Falsiroseomonas sp.]MDP3415302.1 glutathione S-transferase N-terminal domain-containing protein [Falsiroseomonas sp.]
MKLHHAHASPFARKVMACAILRGIEGRIEIVVTDPHASPDSLLQDNPLSKIPTLVAQDGRAVFDSRVICEYLDTVGEAPPLFPPTGSMDRLAAQVRHALADGIMDAAVARRMRFGKPMDETRLAFIARQKAAMERGLAALERDAPAGLTDIGEVASACALGYLDFRFPDEPWRAGHPRLADWFAEVSRLPALARTAPPG